MSIAQILLIVGVPGRCIGQELIGLRLAVRVRESIGQNINENVER